MTRIKICGITRAEDLPMLAELGVDEIGLNFVPTSKRYLADADQIHGLVRSATRLGISDVTGVFANDHAATIAHHAQRFQLTGVQVHDDRPAVELAELRRLIGDKLRLIAVARWDDAAESTIQGSRIQAFLDQCEADQASLSALLFDGFAKHELGGTGQSWNYAAVRELVDRLPLPAYLAGGLKAGNVASAIQAARPAAVDVASGVESAPGFKSGQLVRNFVQAVRSADHGPET